MARATGPGRDAHSASIVFWMSPAGDAEQSGKSYIPRRVKRYCHLLTALTCTRRTWFLKEAMERTGNGPLLVGTDNGDYRSGRHARSSIAPEKEPCASDRESGWQ